MDADEATIKAFADQKATFAFILAVLGFVCLPVISSVFAIIVAHQARRLTRGHPEYTNGGLVTAAMVLGYLGLVAGVGGLIFISSN